MLATILGVRAYDAFRAPPLKLWHTFIPRELDAKQIDAADWKTWLAAEEKVFAEVRTEVVDKLPARDRVRINRYFSDSPTELGELCAKWNRSQVLVPSGPIKGAAVLLHGLTDSPYSLRSIAEHYRGLGFVAVVVRMPGHGTVPGALSKARWEDWMSATRLAVREARRLAGSEVPIHIIGYSNGGALAMKYSLDAIQDSTLARPGQIVLISPMIGVTSMARFAGVLGWPAVFPALAKAAWLDVVPEYNPVKYNSFPVNAARQSSQLTRSVQEQLIDLQQNGRLTSLAPVLTFQSMLDSTVDVHALVNALYARLPDNGSELVLFDRNRRSQVEPLIRPEADLLRSHLLTQAPRNFQTTIIGNSETTVARHGAATVTRWIDFGYFHEQEFYSLSHVALPFPLDDPLYGMKGDHGNRESSGLGAGAHGERGALVVSLDTLLRASCNPFYEYMIGRIDARIPLR